MTTLDWGEGTVSLAEHDAPSDICVVLGHGAGGNLGSMASFAGALAERGVAALRFNFAYSEAGRRAPDRTAKLEAVYRAVAGHAAARYERVIAGGRSMGGRIGSHIVSQGFPAAGLLFLAYPLHAPSKPDVIRDQHLRDIEAPMLFLQGTRDAFAKRELLEAAVARLRAATLYWVEGGDHSHRVRGRRGAEVESEMADVAAGWISTLSR